jgi:hypothetical protein
MPKLCLETISCLIPAKCKVRRRHNKTDFTQLSRVSHPDCFLSRDGFSAFQTRPPPLVRRRREPTRDARCAQDRVRDEERTREEQHRQFVHLCRIACLSVGCPPNGNEGLAWTDERSVLRRLRDVARRRAACQPATAKSATSIGSRGSKHESPCVVTSVRSRSAGGVGTHARRALGAVVRGCVQHNFSNRAGAGDR